MNTNTNTNSSKKMTPSQLEGWLAIRKNVSLKNLKRLIPVKKAQTKI